MSDTKTKLRGVNLGGWLVLEKWMTPSLFTGLKAGDEFGLCEELGPKEASDILRIHRNNFITELDFKWIADRGLNAVRLPVGYWILGNSKPYVGGIEYVDKALDWAEQYGIKVIIDLHGAPGSQNGKDHSGRIGAIGWHKEGNIDRTLKALEELCKRYAGVPCVVGIELLNEPAWKLGKKRLAAYYEQGYKIVRKQMGADTMVIFPDAFRPKRWKRVLRGDEFQNVVMDAHLYQVFSRSDKRLSAFRHLGKAADRAGLIRNGQRPYRSWLSNRWQLRHIYPSAPTAMCSLWLNTRRWAGSIGAIKQSRAACGASRTAYTSEYYPQSTISNLPTTGKKSTLEPIWQNFRINYQTPKITLRNWRLRPNLFCA
jgi:glucan 1,3-beta-glucosidase